jgi:uncharacterized damage-inducible protein DinB
MQTMLDWIHTIWTYNDWGRAKLLVCLDTVSEADFKRSVAYSVGSLHQQVVHTMWAEEMWLTRLSERPNPSYTASDFTTRTAIYQHWQTVQQAWWDYLHALTTADIAASFTMTRSNGEQYAHTVGEVLLHVVNHGVDHRAQILRLIHDYGGETFAQDMIFFFREQQG